MKKIAKFLCAFALVGFAACTNDTTEDQVSMPDFAGGGSVKTLTVALDGQTRIELGEKSAEGKYPVYWQEGDVLRINEGKTSAITIHDDKSVADFTFAVADADAYSVVYPYVEGLEAATEGCLPVKFAEVQNYTEGSFDAASFPLYCYAASNALDGAGLNYLAGILKFEITGAGEVLTQVELTATEGALSGAFDVNCQTGEMTAQTGASKKLTYKLPTEGLTLSEIPVVLYVAVPAGDFGDVSALLCTTDSEVAMKATMSCGGEKAVKAGVVREFKGVTFVDNSASTQGEMFEIDSEAALFEFADMCKSGTFDYAGATVTRSFAMTTEGWEPIENFSGVFEGNGNTIREITKPIFGTTNATIRNVKVLTNVSLSEEADFYWGAVARELVTRNDQTGTIEGCSIIDGSTIELNYTMERTFDRDANGNSVHPIRVGGIVGNVLGGVLTNCENYADITVTSLPNGTVLFYLSLGGVVAELNASEAGEGDAAVGNTVSGCKNYGDLNLNYSSDQQCFLVGGVMGTGYDINSSKCENHGNILVNNIVGYNCYLGGVLGWNAGVSAFTESTHSEAKNTGNITYTAGSTATALHVGGVVGYATGNTVTYDRCVNEGAVDVRAVISSSTGKQAHVGGIIGICGSNITNCVNGVKDDSTKGIVNGGFNVQKASGNSSLTFGGVIGYWNNNCSFSNNTNYAPLTNKGMVASMSYQINAGGLVGYAGYNKTVIYIANSTNYGPIEFDINQQKSALLFGGAVGMANPYLDNVHNEGDITLNMVANSPKLIIGGVAGDINFNIANCSNSGDITLNMGEYNANNDVFVGGVLGRGMTAENLKNTGNISIPDLYTTGGTLYVGGVVGHGELSVPDVYKNFSNTGNITLKGKRVYSAETLLYSFVGGLVGYCDAGLTLTPAEGESEDTYASNRGNIDIDVDIENGGTGRISGFVGGIVSTHTGTLTGAVNRGTITFAGETYQEIRCGGIVAYKKNTTVASSGESPVDRCYNHGKINVSAQTAENGYVAVAGVVARMDDGSTSTTKPSVSVTNVNNSAPITVMDSKGTLALANIVGVNYADLREINVPATAALTIGGTFKMVRVGSISGISAGTATSKCVIPKHVRNTNNAPITVLDGTTITGYLSNTASQAMSLAIGGIVGVHNMKRKDISVYENTNNGAITVTNVTCPNGLFVAGIVGSLSSACAPSSNPATTYVVNNAPITVSGKCLTFLCGGIVGSQQNGDADSNRYMRNTEKGVITANVEASGEYSVAGLTGLCLGMIANSENNGDIVVKGAAGNRAYIGGIVGRKTSSRISNAVVNNGDIEVAVNANPILCVGGVAGFTNNVQWDYIGSSNNGTVTIARDAACDYEVAVGGLVGWAFLGKNPSVKHRYYGEGTAANYGNVLFLGSTKTNAYVGGVVGIAFNSGIDELEEGATATLEQHHSTSIYTAEVTRAEDGSTYVSHVAAAKSFENTAMIRFAGNADGELHIGSIVGAQDGGELGNSTSTQDPAVSGTCGTLFSNVLYGSMGQADWLPIFYRNL